MLIGSAQGQSRIEEQSHPFSEFPPQGKRFGDWLEEQTIRIWDTGKMLRAIDAKEKGYGARVVRNSGSSVTRGGCCCYINWRWSFYNCFIGRRCSRCYNCLNLFYISSFLNYRKEGPCSAPPIHLFFQIVKAPSEPVLVLTLFFGPPYLSLFTESNMTNKTRRVAVKSGVGVAKSRTKPS